MWDEATVSVTGAREPERLPVLMVTDGFLPVLRVQPHLSRAFSRDDDSPATPERVMLGYAYWERAFAAAPDVVGRHVVVDGRPREIIGVVPRDFRFLDRDADLLVPFRWDRAAVQLGDFSYQAVARLKPGVTLEQANADIARMIPMVYDRFPAPPGFTRQIFADIRMGPRVRPLAADVIGNAGRMLWVQIALALVLLVGSGLMVRTFQELRRVNPGFVRPAEVLTFRLTVPEALVPEPEAVTRTHEEIARRLAQIPGVRSVGISSSLTMDGHDSNDGIFLEDFPLAPGQLPGIRRFKWVSPTYFETMGNRLIAGRTITWSDTYDLSKVVMVTEAFTREYWKTPAQAIGRRIRAAPNQPWREIVGVVGDERDDGVARRAPAIVYWPMMLSDWWQEEKWARRAMGYAVRTATPESPTLLREVQKAVWGVNAALPLANVRTLEDIQASSMAQTSLALVMLAIAAVVALLLGVVGIYGVIAYMATERTREIGIRMALGAAPQEVTGLFVRHGLVLTAAGLALGLAAAAALTRLMAALLFGVSAWDPVTYAVVSIALAAIALLASYLPARRASRLDPLVALRAD